MSERSLFLQVSNVAKQSWMMVVLVVFMACVATTSHAWLFKSHYTSSTSNHALITRPSYTIGSSRLTMSTGNNVNMAESLQTWIYENVYNKRDDSKLQLMDSSNGVYAIAKQPIGRDDILFSTPIGYALDMTKANGIFQSAMSGITLKTKDIGMLALLLLHEKSLGKASKYHVYIESLPKVAPGILAWSATLQQQYQQSTTRQIQNINTAIATDIKYIQSNTKLLQLLTSSTSIVEDFTWAIGIVKSRAFYVDNKYVLVPGMDCITFDPYASNEVVMASSGLFGGKILKVAADRSYKAGQKVFMSYGFKSAAECVEDHGMVAQVDATTATCEIEVSIDEVHDRFADDKINILQDNEYEAKMKFDLVGDVNIGMDPELIRFLRLKMISGQDAFILEACFAGTVFHTLNMPFSKSNELAVVEYLINFCEKQLKQLDAVKSVATDRQLSTTVVSDNDGDLMKEVQLAKLRLQERKAIEVTLNMLKTDLSSLQGPMDYREYYQERRLKELDLLRPLDEDEIIPSDGAF